MNQETLAIYAQDLSSYENDDIAAVLDAMGKEAPQDYKQLWPAIGTMLEAIRGRIRARKPSADREAIEKANARIAHFKEHPEEYVSMKEILDALADKRGMA